ncbi:MAG: tRNA-ribosyltransferase [Methanoregulaceae archaeon]|nr:MAG: tRNA-ribosyltransferase [Methanoregulaceae archaeon]
MSDHKGTGKENGRSALLTDPPFYLPEFEKSHRYIIDEYDVVPRDIAIFMPCAVRKPYSASPSHQLIRSVISQVLTPSQYHIVIFGTCGIVPAELEEMYPYAHYHYMLGKCKDKKVLDDFLSIETTRVAGYLKKTRHLYKYRIAYCIGLFRQALIQGSEESGVPFDLILPSRDMIDKVIEEGDCVFEEGSLSMSEYLGEFCDRLILFRNNLKKPGTM